jgi:hypothetical protein
MSEGAMTQTKGDRWIWLVLLLCNIGLFVYWVARWTSGVPEFYRHQYLSGATVTTTGIALCTAQLVWQRRVVRWSLYALVVVLLAIGLVLR